MSERPHKLILPNAEKAADAALASGNYQLAQRTLFEGVKQTYVRDPEKYHHLALKAVALPFYDLIQKGASPERLEAAYSVYGYVGDLLDTELSDLKNWKDAHRTRSQRLGRISEYTIFGLLARAFKAEDNPFPLPSSHYDDTDPLGGTDFYLTSIADADSYIHLQVKTRAKPQDCIRYGQASICVIGLNELDPHYNNLTHADSLASRMIRELSGGGLPEDEEALQAATNKMLQLIIKSQAKQETAS